METTITVNLNNQAFQLEEKAYYELKEYLDKIKTELKGTENHHEILRDIESRIAELLSEYPGQGKIITQKEVESIRETLGNPPEFGNPYNKSSKQRNAAQSSTKSRRLYRHPDNKVLGGVCGGLGVFWNTDPVLLRLLFLIIFLGFGFGLLLYILLWIIVPKARTERDLAELYGDQ